MIKEITNVTEPSWAFLKIHVENHKIDLVTMFISKITKRIRPAIQSGEGYLTKWRDVMTHCSDSCIKAHRILCPPSQNFAIIITKLIIHFVMSIIHAQTSRKAKVSMHPQCLYLYLVHVKKKKRYLLNKRILVYTATILPKWRYLRIVGIDKNVEKWEYLYTRWEFDIFKWA